MREAFLAAVSKITPCWHPYILYSLFLLHFLHSTYLLVYMFLNAFLPLNLKLHKNRDDVYFTQCCILKFRIACGTYLIFSKKVLFIKCMNEHNNFLRLTIKVDYLVYIKLLSRALANAFCPYFGNQLGSLFPPISNQVFPIVEFHALALCIFASVPIWNPLLVWVVSSVTTSCSCNANYYGSPSKLIIMRNFDAY